jgi:NADPH-dependent curcumin reductase CurA
MSIMINHRIVLASRPVGEAELSNFRLEDAEPCQPWQDGQVLVRHHYLSLDPYMRMRMNDAKSYAAPQALGADHGRRHRGRGAAVAAHEGFVPGDHVVGGAAGRNWPWSTRAALACCARSTPRTGAAVGLPGRGGHARRHRLGGAER